MTQEEIEKLNLKETIREIVTDVSYFYRNGQWTYEELADRYESAIYKINSIIARY